MMAPDTFAKPTLLRLLATSALALTSACAEEQPGAPPCTPNPPGALGVLRDAHGRAVMYRGVNLGTAKNTPDHLPPLTAFDYARMAEWGMTSIRLVIFWEALEPTQGVYEESYVAGLRGHIELATAAGLDVLLDLHQDVYGEGFGFVGFPRWTCDEALYASYVPPSEWFLGYLTDEVTECFDRFWRSSELRAAYARAAAHLAARLGTLPGVTALEIINEPYWGGISTSRFEPDYLQPFYVQVAAAVQAVAPDLTLVAEPSVAHNFGVPSELVAPFGCPTWAYAPHYYPLFTTSGYSDQKAVVTAGVAMMAAAALELGAPLAITEVGMEADRPGSAAFLSDFFAALDAYPASAWVWDYGPDIGFALVDREGEPRASVPGVIRPYVTRLAGELREQSWDAETGVYALRWRAEAAGAPTEIVAPMAAFPSGYDVEGEGFERVTSSALRASIDAPVGEATVVLRRR